MPMRLIKRRFEKRIYGLLGWVKPNEIFYTPETFGFPNPEWNSEFYIILDGPDHYDHVYLKIYRTRNRSGAETSNDVVLVGKKKISLPKDINLKKYGQFPLVMPEERSSKFKGKVTIEMELKKIIDQHE